MKTLNEEELFQIGLSKEDIIEACNHYFDLLDSIGSSKDLQQMGYNEEDAIDLSWVRTKHSNKYWDKRSNKR